MLRPVRVRIGPLRGRSAPRHRHRPSRAEAVRAPAAGTVTFVGSVPTHGLTVTIATADGYAVTLTHLGAAPVAKGASVDEGATGRDCRPERETAEHPRPYVHLGIRVAADEHGYVDPLSLLPARARRRRRLPPPAPSPHRHRLPPAPAPPPVGSAASACLAGPRPRPTAAPTRAPRPAARSIPHRVAGSPPTSVGGAVVPDRQAVGRRAEARRARITRCSRAAGQRSASAERPARTAVAGSAPRAPGSSAAGSEERFGAGRGRRSPSDTGPRPTTPAAGSRPSPGRRPSCARAATATAVAIVGAARRSCSRSPLSRRRSPPTGALSPSVESTAMRYYVTTPIYYVNSTPHIGHAYTTIAADVVVRHHRQRGEDTFFLTGVDEHASKVRASRPSRDSTPQEYADRDRPSLAGAARSPQRDERLLHPDDRRRPQGSSSRISCSGSTTTATSTRTSTPASTASAARRSRPRTSSSTASARCTTSSRSGSRRRTGSSGSRRTRTGCSSSTTSGRTSCCPAFRYNEARSFIAGGLQDFSISRAGQPWGVPIPWDPGQVAYVWADALVNYLSALDVRAPGRGPARPLLARPSGTCSPRTSSASTASTGRRCCSRPATTCRTSCSSTATCSSTTARSRSRSATSSTRST